MTPARSSQEWRKPCKDGLTEEEEGERSEGSTVGQEGSSIAICESAIGQASSDALVGGGKGEKEGEVAEYMEEMCMDTTG